MGSIPMVGFMTSLMASQNILIGGDWTVTIHGDQQCRIMNVEFGPEGQLRLGQDSIIQGPLTIEFQSNDEVLQVGESGSPT